MKRIFFFLLILTGASQAQWSAGHFYWSKNGAAQKTDSIRFVQGSGATLTQSGNTLTIAASGTGTTPAGARANTGWTAQGAAIASDTVVQRIEWGGQQNASFKIFDADNDTIMLRPQQNNGGFLYKDATDALASIDTTGRITSGDSYSAAQTISLDGSKAAAFGGTQPELYIEGSDNDNWGLTINTSDQAVLNGASGGFLNRREQATDIDSLLLDPYGSTNGNVIRYSDAGTVLFKVDTSGNLTATNYPVGGAGWTDTGTEIEQTTTTDEVVIGGTAALNSAKVTVDGDADQVLLSMQGHSTQNANTFTIENSAGADVLYHNYGNNTYSALTIKAPAANTQAALNLQASAAVGWTIVRDASQDGTNNLSILDAVNNKHRLLFGTTGNIAAGYSAAPLTPWATLSVSAEAASSTVSITNSTIGLDVNSGLLITVPTSGASTFKSFDDDFEFNSADAAKEYVFDIADDNDNDFIFDDAGVMVFSSGQTNSFQIAPATNDVAAFTSAVGGYTFDAEASVKQHNIQDTTGVVLSAPGAGTISVSNLKLDTFAAAALDTAVTLTGTIGDIIYISTRAATRDIAFLDAGNFQLGGERLLDDPQDVLVLMAVTTTVWKEIYFANNN